MLNPLGRLSRRKFILLVLATISLIFSYLLVAAPAANAADAQWESGSLMYEGKEYMVTEASEIPEDVGIPGDSQVYTYIGGVRLGQGEEMEAIYFPRGSDLSTLNSARFVSFVQSQDGSVSDVSNPSTITVDTTTAAQANEVSGEDIESGVSSCKIDGLGWIICPLTTMLAKGMDWVYEVISGFLEVRPLQTTAENNVMMRAWSVMRTFANIVFVIGFLVIIYSQLTSMGISNYGLKKMLPRLVIAAILVNVSYWICAIAIDLSNIAGISLQQLFIDMRNVVLGTGTNSWDLISWESVAGFVLSGGAIGGAIAVGGVMTLGAIGAAGVGAFYLLLPILLGAFLSVLVVLLILAARQAILTILVVVAPLAMVAYLLPNTEKWFEKWRDLFVNMLVLFPAFSMIFGGAQLAGILIIQNADDITVVILGMAIQVAPLAIVPLLLKLGGNVLTRIAGVVNNPSKGMIDRTRKFSQGRFDQAAAAGMRRNRAMSTGDLKKKRNALRRYAVYRDDDRRMREGLQKVDESMGEAMFTQSDNGMLLHEAEHSAEIAAQTVKTNVEAHIKGLENTTGTKLHTDNLKLEVSKLNLESQNKVSEEQLAAYRAGNPLGPLPEEANRLAGEMNRMARDVSVAGLAAESAKRVEHQNFASYLKDDGNLDVRMRAGSIEGETGANRALASAMRQEQKSYNESVENAGAILSAGNYDNKVLVNAYLKNESIGNITMTDDIKAAITRKVLTSGDADAVDTFIKSANLNSRNPGEPDDLLIEIADSLEQSKARPKYATAGLINSIRQGNEGGRIGDDRVKTWVKSAIVKDKYNSAESLVGESREHLDELIATLSDRTYSAELYSTPEGKEKLVKIRKQIQVAVQSPQYRGKIADRDEKFEAIYNMLPKDADTPDTYQAAKEAVEKKTTT